MLRHGLCGLETSQGRCFQDGKRCGWKVLRCFYHRAWEAFTSALIVFVVLTVIALLYVLYIGNAKPETETRPTSQIRVPLMVTATAYSPTVEECDADPFITAFNERVEEGTIAISRDMEKTHGWKKGDLIYLEGIGVFKVWDRMNRKWKERVDVFFHDTRKAREFGKVQTRAAKL